jgi:hypothetical protein
LEREFAQTLVWQRGVQIRLPLLALVANAYSMSLAPPPTRNLLDSAECAQPLAVVSKCQDDPTREFFGVYVGSNHTCNPGQITGVAVREGFEVGVLLCVLGQAVGSSVSRSTCCA